MSKDHASQVPSPLLTIEDVQQVLADGIGALGSWSGALGGMLGGGAPVAIGGASGGRAGGRFGARHLTRLDADQLTIRAAPTAENLEAVRTQYFRGAARERTDRVDETGRQAVLMAGVVGSGAVGMNPCVVQVVWSGYDLQVTAHAKEGLIKQHTCAKALQSFSRLVTPDR